MTAYRTVELMCDYCDDSCDVTGRTVREIRKLAKDRGWTRIGKEDVCPKCREKYAGRG